MSRCSPIRRSLAQSKLRRAAALAALTLAPRFSSAATIRDDVPDSMYTALSAQPQYAAAGYIDITSSPHEFSSATLIAPDWVLTAAHAVTINESGPAFDPSLITFGQGATANLTVASDTVAQVILDPDYNGNTTDGADLALLQLTTPITTIAPAPIYSSSLGSLLTQTATMVGYGYTGTGLTGYSTTTLGTRRAITNVFDAPGGVTTTGGPPLNNTYDLTFANSDILLTDFDQPNNPSASIMGDSTPTALEGASTPGDSGGGAFVTVAGQTYLAAVGAFIGAFPDNALSTAPDGYYGDFNGYTSLAAPRSANFIAANMIVTSAWTNSSGGTWAGISNWSANNPPEFAQATANFGSAIIANATITLDDAWTVGNVNFNNTNSYTLAAGSNGTLVLDNRGPASSASITVATGSHFISAPITGPSNLQITGPGTLTLSGANTYAGSTTVTSGELILASAAALPSTTALTISSSATTQLAPNVGAVTLSALTLNTGATLDLTNNALLINFPSPSTDPLPTITAYLQSGALTSSSLTPSHFALGYADGNIDPGIPAGVNQLLIAYTLAGDANLDGSVGFSDLVAVAQHFGSTGNDWAAGNFTYDPAGSVGFADLVLVAQNFGSSTILTSAQTPSSLSPLWLTATTTVPEPAAPAIGVFYIWLYVRRRRV